MIHLKKNLKKFFSDEEGISSLAFKLALAVVVFAAVLAVLAAMLNPLLSASNSTSKTMEEGWKDAASHTLDKTK